MVKDQMREDWDRRAAEDAYFYVAFAERKQSQEDFLATAAASLRPFELELARLPAGEKRALEVGCGPGRLMLPMSRHFTEIHGVDVSGEMLKLARETLAHVPHAHVQQTEGSDLRMFASDFFDFVYSYAVFQHIPSRDVVLSYVSDIARVLKPGAIACLHLRGSVPLASQVASQSPTWAGCYFTWEDVQAFVRANALQLVLIAGLDTQYMMVTLRKADPAETGGHSGPCLIQAVSPPNGEGSSVPQTGPGAVVALWLHQLPPGVSLLDLEVKFNGQRGFPYYVSPRVGEFSYQVNAFLPKGIAAGTAKVEVLYKGAPASTSGSIEITHGPTLVPAVLFVSDAVDLIRRTIRSGAIKVMMEQVAQPESVSFHVNGQELRSPEFQSVDPITSTFEFVFRLPALRVGYHTLTIHVGRTELPPMQIEIEKLAK